MKEIPDKSIDLIIADPPFAIDNGQPKTANYNRDASKVLEGYQEITAEEYYQFSLAWISQAHRILRDRGVLIVVSGWSNQVDILLALRNAHFTLQNELIWKHNFGLFTKNRFVSAHYVIFYCSKHPDNFTFNKWLWYAEDCFQAEETLSQEDFNFKILDIKREYWHGKTRTPNKLPAELIEMLIAFGSHFHDLILDPFSGSGTVLKVSQYMLRHCIAFDVVPEFVHFANDQIRGVKE